MCVELAVLDDGKRNEQVWDWSMVQLASRRGGTSGPSSPVAVKFRTAGRVRFACAPTLGCECSGGVCGRESAFVNVEQISAFCSSALTKRRTCCAFEAGNTLHDQSCRSRARKHVACMQLVLKSSVLDDSRKRRIRHRVLGYARSFERLGGAKGPGVWALMTRMQAARKDVVDETRRQQNDAAAVTPSAYDSQENEAQRKESEAADALQAASAAESTSSETKPKKRRGGPQKGRQLSLETRKRISASMTGLVRPKEMREKISAKLRGRVPWNKGKKLSAETRAKMSEARYGKRPWNYGDRLGEEHRRKIALKMQGQKRISEETRKKLQLARRLPSDPILRTSGSTTGSVGRQTDESGTDFPLVDTKDIHQFMMLRRELETWSGQFYSSMGRRPTMTDIRRLAPMELLRKFERYIKLRDSIRGLATSVKEGMNVQAMPAEAPGGATPRSDSYVATSPSKLGQKPSGGDVTLGDSGSMAMTGNDRDNQSATNTPLSANEFRTLGQYRLLEAHDLHKMRKLRREAEPWLDRFARTFGRPAELADAECMDSETLAESERRALRAVIGYLELKGKSRGLLSDVLNIDPDDPQALESFMKKGEELARKVKVDTEEQQL